MPVRVTRSLLHSDLTQVQANGALAAGMSRIVTERG